MGRSYWLFIIGLAVLTAGIIISQFSESLTLPPDAVPTQSNTYLAYIPTQIDFAKLKLSIPIKAGAHIGDQWLLSSTDVLYIPTPYQPSSFFFYAHKRKNLFGDLKKLDLYDKFTIKDNNNNTYTYQIFDKEDIKTTDSDKINIQEKNTIYLLTCDGIFDEKRLLVKARLVK